MASTNRGPRVLAAVAILAVLSTAVLPVASAEPTDPQVPGSHRHDTPPAKPQQPPAKAPPQPQTQIVPQPPARAQPASPPAQAQPRIFQPQPHAGQPPAAPPPPVARAPQPDRPRYEPERRDGGRREFGGDRREFGGDRPRYGDRGRDNDRGRNDRDDDRRGRIAGAIGAGAIIGSIIAYSAYLGPNRDEVFDRCDRDFFDFDYDTGTFENRDGDRETCPYLE